VIIISAPHFVQRYLLPTTFAIFITSFKYLSYIIMGLKEKLVKINTPVPA
jgi:hypothetical protein